jgi:hypothetical protein
MHSGEPKDHEIFAEYDDIGEFFRSLFSPAKPQNADLKVGVTIFRARSPVQAPAFQGPY